MAIQIGKYKRPGIFIEEIDKSIFSTTVTEGITNLVIGVSKKGPVNTPIRLTNVTDLETVFGQLDRNLERKGSFFHRTLSKMLETTPVYAMNLLLTDDALDVIEYKSLSSSSFYKNDVKREGPYRRFFDTTGFWKRDTESFINLTKGDTGYAERALGFTNLSDRYISVFVVKTSVTGFDRTLLEWYGSVEKMPSYVSQLDYASDYMVDVVVVGGDWSNYRDLAVDSRWANYFNSNGLIKSQLRNFANDRNITLLGYYEGLSLIPYFRDLNGRNIFIETTINRDTDSTGLFCEFNAELVEKDFYTGLVDLLGNTLVGSSETKIDFLSYNETISQGVQLNQVPLDLPGNVTALFGEQYSIVLNDISSSLSQNIVNGNLGVYSGVSLSGGYGAGATATVTVANNTSLRVGSTFSIANNTIDATPGTHTDISLGSNGGKVSAIAAYNGKLRVGSDLLTTNSVTTLPTGASVGTYSVDLGGLTGNVLFDVLSTTELIVGYNLFSSITPLTGSTFSAATYSAQLGLLGGTVSGYINGSGALTTLVVTGAGLGYTSGSTFALNNLFGATLSSVLTLPAAAIETYVDSATVLTNGLGYTTNATYSIPSIGGSTTGLVTLSGNNIECVVTTAQVTLSGSGYSIGTTFTLSATAGTPALGGSTSPTITIGSTNLQAVVSVVDVTSSGLGYQQGDVLTLDPSSIGGDAKVTLRSSDLLSLNNSVPSFGGQAPHAFEWGTSGAAISGVMNNGENRTGYFGEGSVSGIVRDALSVYSDKIIVDYAGNLEPAYAVINNTYVTFDPVKSFTINASSYPNKSTSVNYCSVFVLTSSGVVKTVNSLVGNTNPSVASSDVVLGYVNFTIVNGTITPISVIFTDVTINTNGYQDFSFGISNKSDFYVATQSTLTGYSSSIKISFPGTNDTADNTNYTQYRKFKMFYHLRDLIDNVNIAKVCMLVDATNFAKYSLEDASITNIVESRSLDKSFVLNTNIPLADLTDILNGFLVFYTKDNEFILGTEKVITTNAFSIPTTGVVGKYSDFYATYYDGDINTGDFFYDNRLYLDSSNGANSLATGQGSGVAETVDVIFVNGENCPSQDIDYSGYNYIVFKNVNFSDVALASDEQIIIPSSELNNLVFTISNNSVQPTDTAAELATALGYDNTHFAYEVVENVVDEELTSVDLIYDVNSKHYLKMYLDSNGNLYTDFTDVSLESTSTIDTIANNTVYVQSDKSNLKQTIEIEQATGYVSVPNKILVNGSRYTELKVGDFLEADTTSVTLEVGQTFKRKLTRVLSKRQYAGNTALSEITCDSAIKRTVFNGDYQTTRYSSIDQYASTYKAITLKGFKIREASMPNGTEDRQSKVLNLVAKGTPLFKALTNKEAIDFRYLVDSFGLGLTERSKQQLVDICGERLDVFGFINMPSIRSFKNSSSPSFVNSEGVLQAEFIAKGGDPESNPAFLYSFGDGDGVTSVGYFTPYVVVNDNGRPLDFPPASFAATTYIRKHISNVSSVTPWTIAAGVTNGKITNISGLEIDFDPSDIEFLNPAQINPIVLKRNRGYVIETENTALTLYKSALSYIHVREVLIELERELSRMLLDYQWKFNTPDVRSEIKLRADVICETYVSKNGLYNYFNKMDDENNTAEVIDNQIGVLDTYVEPIKGMGIIVNNITILRTGAIAAGGFLNA